MEKYRIADVFIDKVTVLGDFVKNEMEDFKECLVTQDFIHKKMNIDKYKIYAHFLDTFDGQAAVKVQIRNCDNRLAISFNPSKLTTESHAFLLMFLSKIPNKTLYRFDIAFDCLFDVLDKSIKIPNVQAWHIYGTGGATDTISYGKINNKQVSIYNKIKEDKKFVRNNYGLDVDICHRVEFRYVSKGCNNIINQDLDIFKNVEIKSIDLDKHLIRRPGRYKNYRELTPQEKANISVLIRAPYIFATFDKDIRLKTKSIRNKVIGEDLTDYFKQAFLEKENDIKSILTSYQDLNLFNISK